MKPAFRITIAFLIFNIIPVLWCDKVVFNLATFTTEYYKFLYNVFVVGLIALFFKYQTEDIIKGLEKDKKQLELQAQINQFVNEINNKQLSKAKNIWPKIYKRKEEFQSILTIEKINRILENTSSVTLDENFSSDEFKQLIIEITNEKAY